MSLKKHSLFLLPLMLLGIIAWGCSERPMAPKGSAMLRIKVIYSEADSTHGLMVIPRLVGAKAFKTVAPSPVDRVECLVYGLDIHELMARYEEYGYEEWLALSISFEEYWMERDWNDWGVWKEFLQWFGYGWPEVEAELTIVGNYARGTIEVGEGPKVVILGLFREGQLTHLGSGEGYAIAGEVTDVEIEVSPWEGEVKEGEGMVLIPAGEFQMGDAFNEGMEHERPVHTVYLDAFYIDKYEVTNAQYAEFLNDGNGDHWNSDQSITKSGTTYTPVAGKENHPVVYVSWYDADAYSRWAGKRLPTEAEWEKAARGGLEGRRYPWGDSISHDDANYTGTGGRDIWDGTSPVGSFPPNGYGLYDMAGNVQEWVADWYDREYYSRSPENNPIGSVTGDNRVMRGGSWIHYADFMVRCAARNAVGPSSTSHDLGFRCASD